MKQVVILVCALSLVMGVMMPHKISQSYDATKDPNFVTVPGGKLYHKECVHAIPDSSHIVYDEKTGHVEVTSPMGETKSFPPCGHPVVTRPLHGPAWKAWLEYRNVEKISELYGEWSVPPVPSGGNQGQILYYWNGVEPDDNSAVLQPVLQYGNTPAGGGSYWGLASWYVSSINAFYTPLVNCRPGDKVVGDMAIINNGSWVVTGSCAGGQKASFTYLPPSNDYTWAYEVLEAYSISDCLQQYPTTKALVFDNIKVWTGEHQSTQPTWTPQTKNPSCNERATVTSPTTVSILWN